MAKRNVAQNTPTKRTAPNRTKTRNAPPAPKSERTLVRQARYSEMRKLGFSSAEATKYRDLSSGKRATVIESRRKQISNKRVAKRTAAETEQLTAIRESGIGRRIESRTEYKGNRLNLFRQWSQTAKNGGGFPPKYAKLIARINNDAGYDLLSPYGYRVFYYRFVRGYDDGQIRRTVHGELRDMSQSPKIHYASK